MLSTIFLHATKAAGKDTKEVVVAEYLFGQDLIEFDAIVYVQTEFD